MGRAQGGGGDPIRFQSGRSCKTCTQALSPPIDQEVSELKGGDGDSIDVPVSKIQYSMLDRSLMIVRGGIMNFWGTCSTSRPALLQATVHVASAGNAQTD